MSGRRSTHGFMSTTRTLNQRVIVGLLLVLVGYTVSVFLTLPGKYPWHDEITTLRDSRETFSHLIGTYYTHKGYILAAKVCTTLFGESYSSLRLPSIAMGGLSLLAVYWLGATLFRPIVGVVSAVYLAAHPSFLFFSTDARGYQGAFLFSTLAAVFLWRGLDGVKVLKCILAAVALFLGLMMQPTAALTYPGLILVAAILVVRIFREKTEEAKDKKKRLIWLLGLAMVVAMVLIGPRVWNYLRWETLLIPSRFVPETGDNTLNLDGARGPLRSLEGWRIHFAPLVTAELHTERVVTFGWFLMLAGLIFSEPKMRLSSVLLTAAMLSPFSFFSIYNPPFLVQRYLYCATPFAVLLTVWGAFVLGERLGRVFSPRWQRWVRRGTETLLVGTLLWNCWGPFRAEIAYSEYGCTWMVPVSKLAQQDFMKKTRFLVVDEKPLWRDQLEMLGVPAENLALYSPSTNGGFNSLLDNLDDNTWVVLKSYSQDLDLQTQLREKERVALRIEQGEFFLAASSLGSASDYQRHDLYRAVKFLDENFNLDYRFDNSVAQIFNAMGLEELAAGYETRAMEGIARLNRWDYPRTFGAYTSALGDWAVRQNQPEKAARFYAASFGQPQSRFFDYVAFVDKVPAEARNVLVRSWRFDAEDFSRGFIEALERGEGLQEDYKAYWSFKGAQILDQNGRLSEAWALYEFSIDQGDSQGRASQRLFQFHLKEGENLEAARVYLRGIGKPTIPYKNYIDLFEALPEEDRRRVTRMEEFVPQDYAEGLIAALNADSGLNSNEKDFWSERMGSVLMSLGCDEAGKTLNEAF